MASTMMEKDKKSSEIDYKSKENVTINLNSSCDTITNTADEEPYTIYSKSKLAQLLLVTAFIGMISPITGYIYYPAVNEIEKDFGISTEEVNLTFTVYMIIQATSPTFWGTIADSWGRRPVLLMTMVIYTVACIGLALTPNYSLLLVFRMMQAFGSSPAIAISAGILSDIVQSKRRGTFYGFYSIGQSLGPVIGPVLGGMISQNLGWRWIFWLLSIIGCISLVVVGLFVPETLRILVGNGSGYANPTPSQWLARKRGKIDESKITAYKLDPKPKMNFLAPFIYLFEPDVFLLLWFNGVAFIVYYCFMTTTAKQFSIYYPFLSELQIGLCFLSMGFGVIIGIFIRGKLLDRDYRKMNEKLDPNTEFSIYKARLKNIWIYLILMEIVTCIYGWIISIGAPLPVALVLQFLFAFNCSSITSTCQTLLVDLFPGKGASITASNNLVRCILGAAATACIEPAIQGVGIGWIFTILGICVILHNICVLILLKKGPQWKKNRLNRQDSKITNKSFNLLSCFQRA